MVITETFEINGIKHTRSYSDSGFMIASDDGIEYEVAEDLEYLEKIYHEVETEIPDEELDSEEAIEILRGLL